MRYIKNLQGESRFKDFSQEFTLEKLLERNSVGYSKTIPVVKDIEKNFLERGDEYSRELTKKFDKAELSTFKVLEEEISSGEQMVPEDLKQAIGAAYQNITSFHKRQIPVDLEPLETSVGVFCSKKFTPINTVGLYIPGGTAPLFSTLLMLGIPAKIAGCKRIVICTPPQSNGKIAPEILYVAKLIGTTEIYKVGGAQAIFSMTYGSEEIPKVDKIFGPGNSFVTAAKMLVSSKIAIDMPAGPSEVLVIADEFCNSSFVASDLLSQAEHGADSQVVLLCDSEWKIQEILKELREQLINISRGDIATKALEQSFIILTDNIDQAIDISNEYAPEHLLLQVENYTDYLTRISNAGSVFLGKYSCESAGDYASGTNHTLPTSAYAKSYSGVSVENFGKWITFQELTVKGVNSIGKTVEIMSQAEGLDGHKNAMTLRQKYLKNNGN